MNEVIIPLNEYPIDSFPLDMDENIQMYLKPAVLLKDINLRTVLIEGKKIYDSIFDATKLSMPDDLKLNSLFFTVDTGLTLNRFIPNDSILEMIKNHPNIAITDLDKALLGYIYLIKLALDYQITTSSDLDLNEFLYGFIYFFYNVQEYEYQYHITFDILKNANYSKILSVLLFPPFINKPSKICNRKTVKLDTDDVANIEKAISFRKRMKKAVIETRKSEKEYAQNDENKKYWDLFISCCNFRILEENRVVGLIDAETDIYEKKQEFNNYLAGLNKIDPSLIDSELDLNGLLCKIVERMNYACNYCLVKTNTDEIIPVDNSIVSIVALPVSFNCVLIAYHAFLLTSTRQSLRKLINYLYVYVCRNLSQIDEIPDSFEKDDLIEDNIIKLDALIDDFYESHKEYIDSESAQYSSILKEETLSGFSFDEDIYKQFAEAQKRVFHERSLAYDNLDDTIKDSLLSKLWNSFQTGKSLDLENEIEQIRNKMPIMQEADPNEKLEREKCKRLVVSINAIYILAKTIERAIDKSLIKEDMKSKLLVTNQSLSGFEDFLVKKVYSTPKTYDPNDERLNMDSYRRKNGIDASNIEKKYDEASQRAILESIREAINELHKKADNSSFEDINQVKKELREKLNDFTESDLKSSAIDLIDDESNFICDKLIKTNVSTDEFKKHEEAIRNYIGPLSRKLPERTINALATAELLYSKYATPEYATAGFDYSCISALYYQAVESMYNELLWSKYVVELNGIEDEGKSFYLMYRDGSLPKYLFGYLPWGDNIKYYLSDNGIKDSLMMGTFQHLISYLTSGSKYYLSRFRSYFDKVFGYDRVAYKSPTYLNFQGKIDEFNNLIEKAVPKRNAASHGEKPIKIDECTDDKRLVLSDVEGIRRDQLGIIMLFLSLYNNN